MDPVRRLDAPCFLPQMEGNKDARLETIKACAAVPIRHHLCYWDRVFKGFVPTAW